MDKRSNFISEILKDLKHTSKYLTEAYIFDGQEGAPEESGMEMEQPMDGDEGMSMKQPQMSPDGVQQQTAPDAAQSAEEQAMHAQEVIQHEPIVGKIRETAIDGLKKYADHPSSEIYAFFKDVFLSSDKLLTGKGGKK